MCNMLDITGEKVSENQLQFAVERLERETGLHIVEWSVCADHETNPGRYIFFMETEKAVTRGQASLMREILEAGLSLVNSCYAQKLNDGCMDSLILNILQPQTHQLYKDLLAYKGICDGQSESVHILDDPTREKLFRQLIESGKTNRISETARNYKQPEIGKMFRLAAEYSDTINLCNGEPDFDTPMHIVDAAYNALCNGRNKYSPDPGIPSFREAVADKYSAQFGYPFEAQDCLASLGSSEALWLAMAALLDPGDEVIIPDPSYHSYEAQANSVGAVPVRVPLREENGFQLDPKELERYITMRTKAIVLNYPSNPIGAVLKREDAEKLAEVILKYDLFVISDEVYEKLVFDGRAHFSMAQIPKMKDHVIIVNSLSKSYAMTGWRIGYIVCKEKELINSMSVIQQTVASVPPTFIMHAAAAAINGPQECVEDMRRQYERRRDLLYDGLCDIPGVKPFRTEGSICTYINIKGITEQFAITSSDFAISLLKKGKVISLPGTAFGPMGEGYLRLCFANSDENIMEGVRRIKSFVTEEFCIK